MTNRNDLLGREWRGTPISSEEARALVRGEVGLLGPGADVDTYHTVLSFEDAVYTDCRWNSHEGPGFLEVLRGSRLGLVLHSKEPPIAFGGVFQHFGDELNILSLREMLTACKKACASLSKVNIFVCGLDAHDEDQAELLATGGERDLKRTGVYGRNVLRRELSDFGFSLGNVCELRHLPGGVQGILLNISSGEEMALL